MVCYYEPAVDLVAALVDEAGDPVSSDGQPLTAEELDAVTFTCESESCKMILEPDYENSGYKIRFDPANPPESGTHKMKITASAINESGKETTKQKKVPVDIQMVNSKTLHKQLGKSFVPTGKADGRVLGVAIKSKAGYSILLENGAPRTSAIMTMVHELTHIWQYLNWDAARIRHLYGINQNLEVYEGMAKWVEIQYMYLLNEAPTAKREEIITAMRDDPYGRGFRKYCQVYPLSTGTRLEGDTPFAYPEKPL